MPPPQNAIVIDPPEPSDAVVIWLHGLGADGHDFEPVVPMLGLHNTHHVRFIFPHAPHIPVTINNGFVMRAWYDVLDMDIARRADASGVYASEQILQDYIQAEIDGGIASERIVVAGFSQGGAIALHTGLKYPARLAGIMGLSCYLPLPEVTTAERDPANEAAPVFMAHGNQDPLIPIAAGETSRDLLKSLGYSVEWHAYPMQHAVCPDEIRDIAAWLSGVIP